MALEKAMNFSHNRFANSWIKLFDDVEIKENYKEPKVKLVNVENSKVSKNRFNIFIKVILDKKIEGNPKINAKFYLRSTLDSENDTKIEHEAVKIIQQHDNSFLIRTIFDAKRYEKNEIYDLSLEIQYLSKYYELRVGNIRDEIEIDKLINKKVTPYFTNPYGNLSFKI